MEFIKNIAKYSKGIRILSAISIILVLCEVAVDTYLPKILSQIIDRVTEILDKGLSKELGLQFIYKMGGMMVVLAVIGVAVNIISLYTAQKASFGLAHNLRVAAFGKIQKMGLRNIDKITTSSLVVRLTNDVSSVQSLTQQILRVGLRAPFLFVYGIIMAATLNRKLSVVFLFAIVPLIFTILYRLKTAMPVFRRVQMSLDRLNDFVRENLLGIRVVKNYTKEKQQIESFEKISKNYAEVTSDANIRLAVIQPIMQLIMAFTTVGVIWYGGYLYMQEEVTIGVITALLTYITQILMAFRMMSNVIVNYSRTKVSIERIDEIIDDIPSVLECDEPRENIKDGSVEFKNVTFSYTESGEAVLNNMSFKAESGKFTAFLGGTGSGKSTLTHLIPRMYDPEAGTVLAGGVDVKELSLSALRAEVAVVPQFSTLFSETVRSNIMWGNPTATEEDIKKALHTACAEEFVNSLSDGIDTFLARGGKNLSGGQKQRLCIARALVREPKILILDDSLSAVDTETDALIRKRISENYPGITAIIIAQRIKSIKTADMIYVLDGGRIAAAGTHRQLSAESDIYKEIMDSQKEAE